MEVSKKVGGVVLHNAEKRKFLRKKIMATNQRWKTYFIAFLVFCVCSSSHILIYNEELIVVLTFFLFLVFLSNYFGTTIKESLDERSGGIGAELQNFFLLKKNSLDGLFHQHQNLFNLPTGLKDLNRFTKGGLRRGMESGKNALLFTLSQQMGQKLTTLSASLSGRGSELENRLAANQLPSLLFHLESLPKNKRAGSSRQSWDRRSFEKGIKLLQKIEKGGVL